MIPHPGSPDTFTDYSAFRIFIILRQLALGADIDQVAGNKSEIKNVRKSSTSIPVPISHVDPKESNVDGSVV